MTRPEKFSEARAESARSARRGVAAPFMLPRKNVAVLCALVVGLMPLLVTAGLSPARSGEPDTWESISEMPAARARAAATTGKDGRIYILGGNPDRKSVIAYDPDPEPGQPRWDMTIPPMRLPRHTFAAVTDPDGKIYAIGGIEANASGTQPEEPFRFMEVYDPSQKELGWRAIQHLPSEPFRVGHAAVIGEDGRIYVMGGRGAVPQGSLPSTTTTSLEIYDPEKGWVKGSPLTQDRINLSAALGGDGRIYAIGGAPLNPLGQIRNSIEAYDPLSDTWSAVRGLETPRQGSAAVGAADGRIYAIGGSINSSSSLDTIESFDHRRPAAWEGGRKMAVKRTFAAASAGLDGRIYVFGGESWSPSSATPHDSVEVYTPPMRGPALDVKPPRTKGPFALYEVAGAPRALSTDEDGNIWFTVDEQIGRLAPTGHVKYFPIPPLKDPAGTGTVISNSSPHGITVGPDGAIWFAEQAANSIGRMTKSGSFSRYLLPDPPAASVNEFAFPIWVPSRTGPRNITSGPDGALWFTIFTNGRIGRITTGGLITEYPIPTPDAWPDDIALGPDDNLWFTESLATLNGTLRAAKVARITPLGLVTEYSIDPAPHQLDRLRSLTAGPDGHMWFTMGDFVGRFSPTAADPAATMKLLGFERFFAPKAIAAGPDGNMWVSVHRPHSTSPYGHVFTEQKKLIRISADKATRFSEIDIPRFEAAEGAAAWPKPGDLIASKAHLWFGAEGPAGIGRLKPNLVGELESYVPPGGLLDCHNLVQTTPLRPRDTQSESCDMANDTGPLDHILVSPTLNCQVYHVFDELPEHYQQPKGVARDGECGTFIATPNEQNPQEMTVYGPRTVPCFYHNEGVWFHEPGCAPGGIKFPKPFRIQGQRGVLGSGTVKDPYRIETDVTAGKLKVSQTDKYVVGSESYRTDVTVTNPTDKPLQTRIIRAGDCYLQEFDNGTQTYKAGTGGIACRRGPRIEEWTPISPDSRWFGGDRKTMWRIVAKGEAFPSKCIPDCPQASENGAGLTWDVELAPGESATRSHITTFSPFGHDYAKSVSGTEVQEPRSGVEILAEVTVSMEGPAEEDQVVNFRTLDDTATAFEDYEMTEGQVVIPQGGTSAKIQVPVLGDTVVEPDESFSVAISTLPFAETGVTEVPQAPNPSTDPDDIDPYAYVDDATPRVRKPQIATGSVKIKDSGEKPEEGGIIPPVQGPAGGIQSRPAFNFSANWGDAKFTPPDTPTEARTAVPIPAGAVPALNPLQQAQTQSQQQSQQQQQQQQQQNQQQQQQMQQQTQAQTMAALMNEHERERELARTGSRDSGTYFAAARERSTASGLVVRAAGALIFALSLGLVGQVGRRTQKVQERSNQHLRRTMR